MDTVVTLGHNLGKDLPISGGSVLSGQVQDAEKALVLHFRMKIQFLGSHTITLPAIQASSTQKPEMP
jgi:hypothetical protein